MASDNFNRSNSSDLGANWTVIGGANALGISSNQAIVDTATSDNGEVWTADAFQNDHFSQATIVTAPTGTLEGAGVVVLGSTAANTFYAAGWFKAGAGDNFNHRIWKKVAGAFTSLANNATALNANDVVKLTVVGSNLEMFVNGISVLTATDSAIATGKPGLLGHRNFSILFFDDWSGGDGTGSGHPAMRRFGLHGRIYRPVEIGREGTRVY